MDSQPSLEVSTDKHRESEKLRIRMLLRKKEYRQ